MSPRRTAFRVAAAATGALALAVGLTAPVSAAPKPGSVPDSSVTVMTRNLYLGGDIGRPLRAVAGKTGLEALQALGTANAQLWGVVQMTDFPTRSRLLANEITATDPDLVGLQEVALWRTGPVELPPTSPNLGVPNAQDVRYDFLQSLLADLAAAGEPYRVVEEQVESDVEGPAFAALPQDYRDVRLTMRDVMLQRVDTDVVVERSGKGQYDTRFDTGLLSYSFVRGYTWADVRAGAKRLRVVNTHLESQYSYLADAQARELLAGPAAVDGRAVVVLCDCNSDPLDGSQKTIPGVGPDVPHWTAYRTLTGEGGFEDAWLVAGEGDGFTSGFGELVRDPDTSAIDHRIDLVLVRGPGRSEVAVDDVFVVGTDPANKAGGMWPSDHAGVVATVRP